MISRALQHLSIVPIDSLINSENLLVEQHSEYNALWSV
jgi:hypothetical protein